LGDRGEAVNATGSMSKLSTVGVIALLALASPRAAAAPRPLISYFQPMPIVGTLSKTVWGASTVGARDPANGLEDNGANGGVGPQQETYFYWDGKILKGEDGKYHLYGSHWLHSIGFGPPAGGSTGWETSIPMEAVSDNVMGPYVSQGNCYAKNQEGNDEGHNVTALVLPSGSSPYVLSVGEIIPGQMFGSSSANGPWTPLGLVKTNTNGHGACGDLSSNFTFTVGPDNRLWATSRGGCVMDSDQVLGTYKVETNSVLPNLENNDNGNAEDEVIWFSGGYYHIVYNYWNVQRAYHIMSKDGVTNWTSTGLAYQASQSPQNASSKWLRYTDGTVNQWHNIERPGVYQENGHVTHFTFAVTDVDKNASGVSNGGSKILVVPFNGVQFDCDNGDSASCAELAADGGAGGAGAGGTGAGGAAGANGRGGSGGGLAGASGHGGAGGMAAQGGSRGSAGAGGATGGGAGGEPGMGGSIAGSGGGMVSSTGGVGGGSGGAPAGDTGGATGSTGGTAGISTGGSAPSAGGGSGGGAGSSAGTGSSGSGSGCSCGVSPAPDAPWVPVFLGGILASVVGRSRRRARGTDAA
jgi:hypothetical protein